MSGNGKGINTIDFGLENNKKPNRLFQYLIVISLCIHLVIFFHIAGICKSKTLTHIEFTLANISKAVTRNIPRPRVRPKITALPNEIKRILVQKRVVPHFKPVKADNIKDIPDSLTENISMPEMPDSQGLKISDWQPGDMTGINDYFTANDYFEMVRLKIESCKKYPDSARARHVEGRTVIRFAIEPDGRISSLSVIKSSRNRALDNAAKNAVRAASPFSKPPANLFKDKILLEITILFELA